MRKNQFEGLLRNLLHLLPGYSVSGWLLHRLARHDMLLGFCCDPSGFDPERFALVAFALPLFVPLHGGLHLNFGRRLPDTNRREIWWNRLGQDTASTLVPAILRANGEFFHPHIIDSDPSDLLRLASLDSLLVHSPGELLTHMAGWSEIYRKQLRLE